MDMFTAQVCRLLAPSLIKEVTFYCLDREGSRQVDEYTACVALE
jgi:hypothetical protein